MFLSVRDVSLPCLSHFPDSLVVHGGSLAAVFVPIFFPDVLVSFASFCPPPLTGDGHFLKVPPGRTLALGPDIIAIDSIGTTHLRETHRITR